MKKFIQRVFSIKNSVKSIYIYIYKVIASFGYKIKLKRKPYNAPCQESLPKSQEIEQPIYEASAPNYEDIWLKENAIERMDASRDDFFDKTRCFFHQDRYRFACEYTENKDVIDCASGTGYGADILEKLGRAKSVVGVEINKEAVEYANKLYGAGNVKFLLGSILELPFEDNSFDIFTSFETIEHVENEKQQLSEVKRVLKHNGLYILSTPNDWNNEFINPYHVRSYTYESLKSALSDDFEILKIYNQNSGTPNRVENNDQPRSITLTTDNNYHLAECFIAVCRVKK